MSVYMEEEEAPAATDQEGDVGRGQPVHEGEREAVIFGKIWRSAT